MTLSVRLGALLFSLSLTTALILLWRVHFSLRKFVSLVGHWQTTAWSFDPEWLVQQQLAAFTLIYGIAGGLLTVGRIDPAVLVIPGALAALGLTIGDRRVAHRAAATGIPTGETHNLSQWRWFNARKAHKFTRQIESGEIRWVPSSLTVLSLPCSALAIGLFWVVCGRLYPESLWAFVLLTILTMGIPPILACMLGPPRHPLE